MEDLGAPDSYLTLDEGTPVYASGGERVGDVAHVLADPGLDVFEGIVIRSAGLPPAHHFADAEHVREIHERGVVLELTAADIQKLPRPSASPGAMEAGPGDVEPDELRDKLRRAWDLISGKR